MTEKEIKTALKNWRSIVKKYQIPSTKKAVSQILSTFLPFLGLWVLMYFSLHWSIWITLGLAVVNAFFMVRIFIIQHDCGHHAFLKSKRWNEAIGVVCSFFTSIPFKYWAKVHNFHHSHSGQLDYRDIGDIKLLTVQEYKELSRWGRFKYRAWRSPIVLFLIAPAVYMAFSNRYPIFKLKGWGDIRRSQILSNILILSVYVGLALLVGWKKFLIIHATIILLFAIIAFWFFYVQHQHEEAYKQWKPNWNFLVASIKGSTYYKLPKLFNWLTGNIGVHHIHHLAPRIPNYNLMKCARENPVFQKYTTIITFRESLNCVFNKLWDEQMQKMISFREFYRREQLGMV